MKTAKSFLAALILIGSVAGSGIALAADGVISKDELTPDSYCHMKFPAMQARSLGTDEPTLKSPTSGDVVDFYGSCDEKPTGQDQVGSQELDLQHQWESNYDE